MIELTDIVKLHEKSIPERIKREINVWISNKKIQGWIKKALTYSLTDEERNHIFSLRNKYPRIYWLLFIYIHPLTIFQAMIDEADKLIKQEN